VFITVSKQPTRILCPSDESSPHPSELILTILCSMSSYRGTGLPNDFFLLYLPTKSACISPLLHTYHIFHPFRPSLLYHLILTYLVRVQTTYEHLSQHPPLEHSTCSSLKVAYQVLHTYEWRGIVNRLNSFFFFLIANKCVQILDVCVMYFRLMIYALVRQTRYILAEAYSIKVQIYHKILLVCLYRTMSCRNRSR